MRSSTVPARYASPAPDSRSAGSYARRCSRHGRRRRPPQHPTSSADGRRSQSSPAESSIRALLQKRPKGDPLVGYRGVLGSELLVATQPYRGPPRWPPPLQGRLLHHVRGHDRPGVFGQPVSPSPASRKWARTGSLRFPGSPSHAFALFQDPDRTGRTSPLAVLSMLPPVPTLRMLQRDMISGLPQGFSVRCLRFTSGVAVAHARLASSWRAAPLPGGGRTLWTAMKGFKFYPSSFPGLS